MLALCAAFAMAVAFVAVPVERCPAQTVEAAESESPEAEALEAAEESAPTQPSEDVEPAGDGSPEGAADDGAASGEEVDGVQESTEEKGTEEGVPPALSFGSLGDAIQGALERVWVPRSRLTSGPHVRSAFEETVAEASKATVGVYGSGRRVALGGVVGPDGWVLTKASRLSGPLTCKLRDGRELDARVVGVDREWDLAVIKIDAKGLDTLDLSSPVSSRSDSELLPGDWVATVGSGRAPVAVGVVSVAPRPIRHQRGVLGVRMDLGDGQSGARIVEVYKGTGADEAGVESGDLIVAIEGVEIASNEQLSSEVQRFNPGDQIAVALVREGRRLVVYATLSERFTPGPNNRSQLQNEMGGKLSRRRHGFPTAMQHDTVLRPIDCGGPLVDLDGRVVGFNLARSGRTESYAAPVDVVRDRLFDLMSGRLAPTPRDQPN
ncbi:S1C family serine protease [Pseudobythopirellula maris]|uniref:S1C family serine protease n=1 Tax=Pseudobythopirellula maris TaxID=2527991 RepID=UPI0011B784C1|nr:trypsin-like peptidase domain-containing protein [Pseudobythopirellula maris]